MYVKGKMVYHAILKLNNIRQNTKLDRYLSYNKFALD